MCNLTYKLFSISISPNFLPVFLDDVVLLGIVLILMFLIPMVFSHAIVHFEYSIHSVLYYMLSDCLYDCSYQAFLQWILTFLFFNYFFDGNDENDENNSLRFIFPNLSSSITVKCQNHNFYSSCVY